MDRTSSRNQLILAKSVYTYLDTPAPCGYVDSRNLTKTIKHYQDGTTTPIYTATYTNYDKVGNRTMITEANETGEATGDHTDFTYDGSYRLRTETRKTSSNSTIYAYDYQYDEMGNRITKALTTTGTKTYSYTYGDNNMLNSLSVTGGATGTFGYDNFGNQTSRNAGGQNWTYGYDSRNQMTSATLSGTTINFKYDPMGRRIEKTKSGTTTHYIYNGDSMIAEADGTNTIIAWYTPGICETRNVGGVWKTFYYTCDGLGSTRELTNDLQQVTDAYAYNAWGENHGQLRPSSDGNKPVNPLRFAGKSGYYSDDDLGLDLLGVRYYDPLIGRFITQDPSRDGANWYAYAGNNPVNAVDPMGLQHELFYPLLMDTKTAKEVYYPDTNDSMIEYAFSILTDFYLGRGAPVRRYGPNAHYTELLRNSNYLALLTGVVHDQIDNGSCQGIIDNGFWSGTVGAAVGTFFSKDVLNGAALQTGDYKLEWWYNAQKDTIGYKVTNTIDYNSWALHAPEMINEIGGYFGLNASSGWGRSESKYCGTMTQYFTWSEHY